MQPQRSPKINFREILWVVRFSTFATISTQSGPQPWWRTSTLRPKRRAGRASIAWLPRQSITSAPHEAFELAFRPGQRLLHGLALVVAQTHLGQRRPRVDLLRDLRRSRRSRNRQGLVVVRVGIVIERTLWRSFLGPCLQGGELLECRQVVAAT